MNKKTAMIFTLIAAVSTALASCGSNDNSQTRESAADFLSETTNDTEINSYSGDTSEADSILQAENTIASDNNESKPESFENTSNPLKPIIEKITNEIEWPTLDMVTDSTILSEYFLLDASNENYKNFIVMQCPISAIMSEIIIIDADDVNAAEEDLNARRQKAIDQDAWYPNDVETANNSIVGTNGSYAYFIIGEEAEATENIINDYIDSVR